jgi:hypothetical protein
MNKNQASMNGPIRDTLKSFLFWVTYINYKSGACGKFDSESMRE